MIGRVAVVCLLALALPLQHRLAEADRGDSTKEKKTQRDNCHDPIKETPNNNPHNTNYPCPLLNQLRYYANCDCVSQIPNHQNTYGFSVVEKQQLLDWISATEVQLEGFGDINDTCVVEVGLSFQIFLEAHVTIKNAISFLTLNDSNGVFWGTFQDFISVHIEIQFEICGPVLELDSNDQCEMNKAINAAAQSSGDQKIIDECKNATRHIKSLLRTQGFNLTEKLSFIYQIIVEQCSEETITFLLANCDITGFGSFRSILNVCKVNFRIQRMNVYMRGSSDLDCDFINDLEVVWDATCFTGSLNNSQCGTLGELMDEIKAVFSLSIDIEFRMEMCASHIWDYCKLAPWICNIGLKKGGCSLYDVLYSSAFCHNEGCCDWNEDPPELPDCSCSDESSSSSGSNHGSSSGSGASSGSSSGGSGSGSSSMETEAPCVVTDSSTCESGSNHGSSSGSGASSGSSSGGSGSGSSSMETATPCDGTGPCDSGETVTPPDCDGTGPCASGETVTPPDCDGTGPCASGETTPAVSVPAVSTPAVSTPAVSTPAVSTPAVTTPKPSSPAVTTPAGTTPVAPSVGTTPSAHCEDRVRIISIDVSCNCSAFFLSITRVTNGWGFTKKQSINPYLNQIQKILYSNDSPAKKIFDLFTKINDYNPNSTPPGQWREDFLSITIYEMDMVTVWGSVRDFLTCTSSCTCPS